MDTEMIDASDKLEVSTSNQIAINNHLSLRFRFGEAEFEAAGSPSEVNYHAEMFFAYLSRNGHSPVKIEALPPQAALLGENKTPLLVGNGVLNDINEELHSDEKFLQFYLGKTFNPSTKTYKVPQSKQLLLITSYKEQHDHVSRVKLTDYQEAYIELESVPVSCPANLTARLSELVDRGYLRKTDEGYSLTVMGKQFLEAAA